MIEKKIYLMILIKLMIVMKKMMQIMILNHFLIVDKISFKTIEIILMIFIFLKLRDLLLWNFLLLQILNLRYCRF